MPAQRQEARSEHDKAALLVGLAGQPQQGRHCCNLKMLCLDLLSRIDRNTKSLTQNEQADGGDEKRYGELVVGPEAANQRCPIDAWGRKKQSAVVLSPDERPGTWIDTLTWVGRYVARVQYGSSNRLVSPV